MATTVVSSNVLPLRSPFRLHGALQLAYACIIAAMAVKIAPAWWPAANRVWAQVSVNGDVAPDELWRVLLQTIGLLLAVWIVIKHAFGGLHRLLSFFVPAGVPGNLENPEETSKTLFISRMFGHFELRGALMQKALVRMSPRLAYLTRPGVQLLQAVTGITPVIIAVLLMIGLAQVPTGRQWIWVPLGVVLAAKAVYALALMVLTPRQPVLHVTEERRHADGAGNPVNFLHNIENIAQELRHRDFPNRIYSRGEPGIVGVQADVTSTFHGWLLFETQPLPRKHWLPAPAALLALAGIVLGVGGMAVLFFMPVSTLESDLPPPTLLPFATGALLALFFARRFFGRALALLQVFRFESHLFWVDLKGTFTSSAVGLGDGRGGQFFAERRSIQSDTYIHAFGTKVITECSGANALRAPRYIVDTAPDEAFTAAFARLLDGMQNFKDSTDALPTIGFDRPGVKEIVQANLQITQAQAQAVSQASLGAPPPLPALSRAPAAEEKSDENTASPAASAPGDETDWKTCPECGEKIRAAARKCRFCNFRFEESTT